MRRREAESGVVVVLASGRGTRMGGPKALMDVGGEAWWRVQERRLEGVGLARVWVVSERVELALRDEAGAPSWRVVGDEESPMLTSVLLGVRAAMEMGAARVFVLPVDTPAPGRGVWDALAGSGEVAVPEFGGERGHPICLRRGWVERNLLDGSCDPGTARLDGLVGVDAVMAPVEDGDCVVNLNTREDVEAWLMKGRGS